jgi:EmrB/QacA subfamily drug resistance transporter
MTREENTVMDTTTILRPAVPESGVDSGSVWADGHPRRRQILLVLCLSLLVVVIDNTILNTALPTLARVLHAGTSSLQWITDAYALCFAALLIPAGALGDRFGRRRALLAGLTVFALGSITAAFAPGTAVLIVARVVMGFGAAFVMPATLSILNAVFPRDERAQAIATWSAVAGVGIVIGPTVGGLLLSHFWWGSVFLLNVPLVAVAIGGVAITVPETAEPDGHRLDVIGALMIAGALFTIVDAIIEAPGRGWLGGVTIVELLGGLAVLGGFAWWELHVAHPLIDLRVFASRAFSAAAASVTVIFFALLGSLFVLTQYLQLVHGYSPLSAGLRALPFAFAIGAMAPISPLLTNRFGMRVVVPAGIALMGLGLFGLSMLTVHTAYPGIALAVAIMGAGMGLVMAPASTTIMTAVPAHQAGAGSAINDTVREVGGALGVAVVGSLSAATYRSQLGGVLVSHHASAVVVRQATSSVAAANIIGQRIGGTAGADLVVAAHTAFVNAMDMGIRVAACVALVSAVVAVFALPRRSRLLVEGGGVDGEGQERHVVLDLVLVDVAFGTPLEAHAGVEPLRGRHVVGGVQEDRQALLAGAVDARPHEGLADAAPLHRAVDGKEPNLGLVRVAPFAPGRIGGRDVGDRADDAFAVAALTGDCFVGDHRDEDLRGFEALGDRADLDVVAVPEMVDG